MGFYSTTPELDIITIQMCTLKVTLNPTTSAIFCISDETTDLFFQEITVFFTEATQ